MYEFKTTFWDDFTIADRYGEEGVKDTFVRAFWSWREDTVFVTELAIVTNWKCWQHWREGNDTLAKAYAELYYKVRGWCLDHLKGEDLRYYLETTD